MSVKPISVKRINMKKSIVTAICLLGLMTACQEENIRQAYGANDGVAPGQVEIVSSEAIPGGVIIHYKNPADEDLMYVKACYTLSSGKNMEVRVSAYDNKVKLEGFNDVNEKEVTFYSVDRLENKSEPMTYPFTPGVSSLTDAFQTIQVEVAFGGATVLLENKLKGNLIVDVLSKDSLDQWYSVQTEYTSNKSIRLPLRGFKPEERIFGVCLRDRWDNVTDTVFATLTPLEEYQLDKKKFREVVLPNDEPMGGWGWTMNHIWDGITSGNNMGHTNSFNSFPVSFTFDLGTTTKLSRYVYWSRQPDYWYKHGNMKEWEIYGRTDKPDADGSWDGWTLLRKCESVKPSGLPVGQQTTEDIEHATKGEEFEFGMGLPSVRYIRMKVLKSFDGTNMVHMAEVSFYGQKNDNK